MKHVAALVADMIDDAIKQMNTTKNTLEFEIPEGYEIDKEQSTNKKVVYKKIEKYEPQEGDLVYAGSIDGGQASIYLYESYSPSIHRGFNSKGWNFSAGTVANVQFIRRATADETVLFTNILAKNGYKYDPQKKAVRKSWRAKDGEIYFYLRLIVCMSSDSRCLQANEHYCIGNYFRTREEAEAVAAMFRKMLNKRK